MKRYVFFLLIIVIIAMILPGCGDDTATDVPGGEGVLKLYGIDPYTLDPALAAEMTSHEYIVQLYGGLVRFDEEMETVPDIAASWDISEDHTVYTFNLRDDVFFHNGKGVTAHDVKYSWERACTPATGSPVAQTYLGDIAGAAEMLAGKAGSLGGVLVLDDYKLQVTIDAPKSYFLSKLTYPTTFVVDEESVKKGADWWYSPNGTGPFKLSSWVSGNSLVLERNARYHGQVASLEKVEYGLWSGVPMIMYETGEIDVAGVSVNYIDRVNDPAGPFWGQLQVTPELSFSYLGFNAAAEPFDDVHVRRAFTMALDKERIIDVTYRNLVENARGILPPGLPGYNEEVKGLSYNPEGALEELALSRYGSAEALPDITLTTSGYGGNISGFLSAAVIMWRENLGVEVSIRVLEPQFYLYNLKAEKDQMYELAWIADYPHPQNFLDVLFRSGGENNFGEYSNARVDELLDAGARAPDEETGYALYHQVEQILVDEAAVLPLWFGQNYTLVKNHVKGYKLNAMGLPVYNTVVIEETS